MMQLDVHARRQKMGLRLLSPLHTSFLEARSLYLQEKHNPLVESALTLGYLPTL